MIHIKCKYLFLIPFLLINLLQLEGQEDTIPVWVQELEDVPEVTYEEAIEMIFGSLNTEEITTGILADRTFQWVRFADFTGELTDTAGLEFDEFEQLYQQLYEVKGEMAEMPALDELRAISKAYEEDGIIPIVVVDFEYDQIKNDAFDKNLLVKKGSSYYDVFPRTESPYETKRFYAAIPYREYIEPGAQTLQLSESLYFTNTERELESVDIYNGDQAFTLLLDEPYEVEIFPDTISLETFYSNSELESIVNSIETDAAYIAQKTGDPPMAGCGDIKYTNDDVNKLCDPAWVKGNAPGLGKKRNEYGLACYPGCNTNPDSITKEILKPLIIIEGFDQHNGRHFWLDQEKYNEGKWSPEQHLYFVSNDRGMCDTLRERGYDVLIFNCADGTGDIPTNGLQLIETIKWVNAQKSTTEEIIIIGASMGGLITRYALSKMEEDGIPHYTKLMITFDTPHRGANVALGLQTLMDDLNENKGSWSPVKFEGLLDEKLDPIKSVAAQQMLLHHLVSSKSSNTNSAASPLFDQFHNQLDQINGDGYPNSCRKVAIACGSTDGTKQSGIGEHDNLATINLGATVLLLNVAAYLKVKSTPNNTSSKKKISQAYVAINGIPIVKSKKKVKNTTPYDNAPAGYECFHHALNLIPSFYAGIAWSFVNINPGLDAFVPTFSALDLNPGVVASDDLLFNIKNSIGIGSTNFAYTFNNNITPFDAIYASPNNTRHVISSMNPSGNLHLFDFAIGEASSKIKYLQNRNIDYPVTISAHNKIIAGRNVDPNQSTDVGDFQIHHPPPEGVTNIIAGHSITLKDGFKMSPVQGLIKIDPSYFDCNEGFPCTNEYEANIPQLVAPGNNGFFGNDVQKVFHSIIESERQEILIYPNPSFDGNFLLVLPAIYDLKYSILVFDLSGKVLLKKDDSSYNFPLDLSEYPKGMYVVKVVIGDKIEYRNIVIQ